MRRSFALVCVISVLAMVGCENGFQKFYSGQRYERVRNSQVVGSPPTGARLIGTSTFVSSSGEGDSHALTAAKSVGADFVLWNSEYKGTTQSTGMMPITTPTTNTTQYSSYSQGNVYGQRGYAGSYNMNTSGTATTYGTQTMYMPYTVIHHWMQYRAAFYRSDSLDVEAPKP